MKLAALMLTAGAMIAFAQPPIGGPANGGPGRRGGFGPPPAAFDAVAGMPATGTATNPGLDAVKTYLELTDTQITGFQAVRQTAATSATPIQTQLQTKLQALRTALGQTPVDTASVTSLQTEIAALRTQLENVQTNARTQMIALLSAAQKLKLASLEAAAALRDEIQGAAGIGLLAAPAGGGRGGFGPR
ncbi:MAG: Spy/CpxP family protein refolding chaperone [Acidobacteriota bacterium]